MNTEQKPDVAELLRPRIKVIAPYPGMICKVGDIISEDDGWFNDRSGNLITNIDKYPHLFKRLEWWEERTPEQMPEYMKWETSTGTQYGKVDRWEFVKGYSFWWVTTDKGEPFRCGIEGDDLPATQKEYESFIQKSKS